MELPRARRRVIGGIAAKPTSTGTMTSAWAQRSAPEIARDIEAMKHALIAAQAQPATIAMPIVAMETIIRGSVSDPYEQARRIFNVRHGSGEI